MDAGGYFRGGLYYGPGEAPYRPSPSPYRKGEPRKREPKRQTRPYKRGNKYVKPLAPKPKPKPLKPFKFGGGIARKAGSFGKAGLARQIIKHGWKLPFRMNPWALAAGFAIDLIPFNPKIENPIQVDWAAAGFTLCCDTGDLPDSFCTNVSRSCLNVCGVSGQVPCFDLGTDLNTVTGGSIGRIREYKTTGGNSSTSPWRGTVVRVWYRPDVWKNPFPPVPLIQDLPQYWPSPAPYFTPFSDDAPIEQPAPHPLPAPWPMVRQLPRVQLWPQGRSGEEPSASASPGSSSSGSAVGPRNPRVDENAGPAKEVVGPGPTKPGRPHAFYPPSKGQREKKGAPTSGKATKLLKYAADQLGKYGGEAADFIDAAYYALDKRCPGAKTPQAKLKCIYDNYQSINFDKLIKNLAMNELQDRGLGFIGKQLKKAARENPFFDDGRGYQTGGSGARFHKVNISS